MIRCCPHQPSLLTETLPVSNEGTIEKKERLQKETSEPERVKNTEYRGSESKKEIQHNKKIEAVLSSEILRP